MAALVEKGVDVTGKNLADVPDLIDSISEPVETDTQVKVGDIWYDKVTIGNLVIAKENLKTPIGTAGTDYCWYNNDKSYCEPRKYGLLYRLGLIFTNNYFVEDSATIKALLPPGWRIMKNADWNYLFNLKGREASQYKSNDPLGWDRTSYIGSNSTGLSVVGAGYRKVSGFQQGNGNCAFFPTGDDKPNTGIYIGYSNSNVGTGYSLTYPTDFVSVRICRNT